MISKRFYRTEQVPTKVSREEILGEYSRSVEFARKMGWDISQHALPVGRFHAWLNKDKPEWRWDKDFQVNIQNLLETSSFAPINLIITLPPRHSKSEHLIRFASWRLNENPAEKIVFATGSQKLANKFSRNIRKIVKKYQTLSEDANQISEWETCYGGGLKAVGVGAQIVGYGANLILIDDVFRKREDFDSEVYRDKVYDWFTDDIYTRKETPNTSIVIVNTRGHEDDLIGRLIDKDKSSDKDKWTYLRYPALAEDRDPLGRREGEPLWPERFNREALEEIKTTIGEASFTTGYQGRPVTRGGGLLKAGLVRVIEHVPADIVLKLRYWDLAGTEGQGDWTAGALLGLTSDGRYVILDIVKGQWSPDVRKKAMLATANRDGDKVRIWFERDVGINGSARTLDICRILSGYSVSVETPTGSKIFRAEPLASCLESGNLYMVEGSWNFALLDEMASFPHGKHDDQVDALSGAYSKLSSLARFNII